MHSPLILCLKDSREVMLLNKASALESEIEAIDVVNDEYLAYDSSGLKLKLDVNANDVPKVSPTPEHRPDELRTILLRYYETNPFFTEDKTLSELVEELKRIYHYKDA